MNGLNYAERSKVHAVIALNLHGSVGDPSNHRVFATPWIRGASTSRFVWHKDKRQHQGLRDNRQPVLIAPTRARFHNEPAVGANATFEIFTTGANASTLTHIHTVSHKHIVTPNRIAARPMDPDVNARVCPSWVRKAHDRMKDSVSPPRPGAAAYPP